MSQRPPFLVVGAGAQGLTFALELALRGEPVVLAEASGALGGQARSFRYGAYTFDYGLHAFVTRDPALIRFLRRVLGRDFRLFRPRAASRLGNGSVVEDTSSWCVGDLQRRLHALVPAAEESWNCMRISEPPPVVYPRRGGFGGLFERMAALFVERGGRLLLDTPVTAADLELRAGRVSAVRLAGRRMAVRGVYWAAGAHRLATPAARPAAAPEAPGEALILFHFMVDGPATVPYHWVRLHGVNSPLLPRLVYYPARFSPANAPRGRHGVGAVVPLAAAAAAPPEARALLRWFNDAPLTFARTVVERLERDGLLRRDAILETAVERMPLPAPRAAGTAGAWDGVADLWDASRWTRDDPRESGVALQMRGAMDAARAVTA
ncbi:MAG: NAD(P)-binding protein [Elusimicrobiota bacterium]|nr:NAD(P)-binding protein [Elusimicrobiota bacterium]